MRRLICGIFILNLILTVFTACGGEKTLPAEIKCEDILEAAVSVGNVSETKKMYLKSNNDLDSFTLSLWANGSFEECDEFAILKDYAICFATGSSVTYEIAVLRAENTEATGVLKGLIDSRKETLALGDAGMYDTSFKERMENSKVIIEGEFVILLITDDNDAVINEIEKLKK